MKVSPTKFNDSQWAAAMKAAAATNGAAAKNGHRRTPPRGQPARRLSASKLAAFGNVARPTNVPPLKMGSQGGSLGGSHRGGGSFVPSPNRAERESALKRRTSPSQHFPRTPSPRGTPRAIPANYSPDKAAYYVGDGLDDPNVPCFNMVLGDTPRDDNLETPRGYTPRGYTPRGYTPRGDEHPAGSAAAGVPPNHDGTGDGMELVSAMLSWDGSSKGLVAAVKSSPRPTMPMLMPKLNLPTRAMPLMQTMPSLSENIAAISKEPVGAPALLADPLGAESEGEVSTDEEESTDARKCPIQIGVPIIMATPRTPRSPKVPGIMATPRTPRSARSLPALRQLADRAASKSCASLVASNGDMASWCFPNVHAMVNLVNVHTMLNFVTSLVQARPYAALSGDVLLIGSAPGVVESAVMLAGAEVRVSGSRVRVVPKDAPGHLLCMGSNEEAEKFASRLRAAAGLWDSAQQAADEALSLSRAPREAPKAVSEEPVASAGARASAPAPAAPLKWSRLSVYDLPAGAAA